MDYRFFNWEDDEELGRKAKVVNMPMSSDEKAKRDFDALEKGFSYSDNGMLEKVVDLPNKEVVTYYDANELLEDSKGRRYFVQDGIKKYKDNLNNVYYVKEENGEVVEYMFLDDGDIMVFKNPEHTLGITSDGAVYQYDEVSGAYVDSPESAIFPTFHR